VDLSFGPAQPHCTHGGRRHRVFGLDSSPPYSRPDPAGRTPASFSTQTSAGFPACADWPAPLPLPNRARRFMHRHVLGGPQRLRQPRPQMKRPAQSARLWRVSVVHLPRLSSDLRCDVGRPHPACWLPESSTSRMATSCRRRLLRLTGFYDRIFCVGLWVLICPHVSSRSLRIPPFGFLASAAPIPVNPFALHAHEGSRRPSAAG
jgi:hypothetical protein